MALNEFTPQEQALPFSMDFKTACAIFDRQQRLKAKTAIRKVDRMKKKLTIKEKLIKWTQLGGKISYKGIKYEVINGMGMLKLPNGQGQVNATISDFSKACEELYGKKFRSF